MIMSIATELTRIQQAKQDIKAALISKGCTVPSSTTIDGYPAIVNTIQAFDPYNGHDYVEIGGLKWATMNIGANSITDYGQYFQWGDTTGYVAANVGASGTTNAKPFVWADYKFGNGTTSPGTTGQTKYNSTDSKTVLDLSDDAARVNWGGAWRMPTTAELQALGNAVNTAWTANYQDSGVAGMIFTDKTDSSKKLFFPAGGGCFDSSVYYVGLYGYYWTSSLASDVRVSYSLRFIQNYALWDGSGYRYNGCSVRPVID